MSNEEDPEFTQMIEDISINEGLYLFPEFKFQCDTDINRIRGYFLVDPADASTSLYFQIWRKQSGFSFYSRVDQVNLNLSANCENTNSNGQCYVDYVLSDDLDVESGDFIGFFTENDTLARPLFSLSMSDTSLYLLSSRFNRRFIQENSVENDSILISYHPQVMGKLRKMLYAYHSFRPIV